MRYWAAFPWHLVTFEISTLTFAPHRVKGSLIWDLIYLNDLICLNELMCWILTLSPAPPMIKISNPMCFVLKHLCVHTFILISVIKVNHMFCNVKFFYLSVYFMFVFTNGRENWPCHCLKNYQKRYVQAEVSPFE